MASRTVFLSAILSVAAAFAADIEYSVINDGKTLCVSVPEGTTNTFDYANYAAALTGNAYTNLVKLGRGGLDMKDSVAGFAGDIYVNEGSLRYWSQYSLGSIDASCKVIVADGATLAVCGDSTHPKFTLDGKTFILEGFGVDGIGTYTELERNAFRFEGKFLLTAPKKTVTLKNIEQQGFLFFAGEMTVSKKFTAEDTALMLDFKKMGINVVHAAINGTKIDSFMWEPYRADVSSLIKEGENELTLTLVGNLRNMQGPFHLTIGESYNVCPGDFYKEPCLWFGGNAKDRWTDDYCFAHVSIGNRKK
jgi:hypothetical protein